jgi:putative transposase
MKKDLALTALKRAIAVRRPSSNLLHHSDRGSQPGLKRSSQHVILAA